MIYGNNFSFFMQSIFTIALQKWLQQFYQMLKKNSGEDVLGHEINEYLPNNISTDHVAKWLWRPLHDREVVVWNPGQVTPKTLKVAPTAFLSGTQHWKDMFTDCYGPM